MADVIWLEAVFVAMGAACFAMNVVVTRRLWASPMFERGQKVAQTVLLWLLPGSVFLVWGVVRDPTGERRLRGSGSSTDAALDWLSGAEGEIGGHHGDHNDHTSHVDGHGGFDGHGH